MSWPTLTLRLPNDAMPLTAFCVVVPASVAAPPMLLFSVSVIGAVELVTTVPLRSRISTDTAGPVGVNAVELIVWLTIALVG